MTSFGYITWCDNDSQMHRTHKPSLFPAAHLVYLHAVCLLVSDPDATKERYCCFLCALLPGLWFLIEDKDGGVFSVCLFSVQTNRSLNFLENRSPQHPFFLMLSPPAPHSPWTAAPQYQKEFVNVKAPRDGSFDKPGKVCPKSASNMITYW